MLTFDHDAARWSWDLDRIHAKGYTDNVVDLMVGKLTRLPAETQNALQQLACLGNIAEITTLSIVLGTSEEQVHAALWPAVRQELVERLAGAYRFVHDRVQEAAYSLIPEEQRAEAHLRIGRLLAAHTPPEKREEAIFDIVNQLNRGAALITSRDEREQLAELNLTAGQARQGLDGLRLGAHLSRRGCGAAAGRLLGAPARAYLRARVAPGRMRVRDRRALPEAEQRLLALATRAATPVERAAVACLRVDLYTTLSAAATARSAVGLDYLRHLGIDWSAHPHDEDVRREYERIWSRLGSRTIEELIDLPLMSDARRAGDHGCLTELMPPALFTDANLRSLVVLKAVNLSLERGNSDASCVPYVMFGAIAGARFGDYQAGFRFGQLGTRAGRTARTFALSGQDLFELWQPRPALDQASPAARDAFRRAFEAANSIGDLTFAAFSCASLNTNFLAAGDPLAEAQREAEHGLQFAEKVQFALLVDIMTPQLGLIRMLRGLTPKFGAFDDEQFDELRFEQHFSADPAFALPESWYWIRKLQARFSPATMRRPSTPHRRRNACCGHRRSCSRRRNTTSTPRCPTRHAGIRHRPRPAPAAPWRR